MMIVKSPKWKAALRNVTESPWGGKTTPLRKLIRKMPGTLLIMSYIVQVTGLCRLLWVSFLLSQQ